MARRLIDRASADGRRGHCESRTVVVLVGVFRGSFVLFSFRVASLLPNRSACRDEEGRPALATSQSLQSPATVLSGRHENRISARMLSRLPADSGCTTWCEG